MTRYRVDEVLGGEEGRDHDSPPRCSRTATLAISSARGSPTDPQSKRRDAERARVRVDAGGHEARGSISRTPGRRGGRIPRLRARAVRRGLGQRVEEWSWVWAAGRACPRRESGALMPGRPAARRLRAGDLRVRMTLRRCVVTERGRGSGAARSHWRAWSRVAAVDLDVRRPRRRGLSLGGRRAEPFQCDTSRHRDRPGRHGGHPHARSHRIMATMPESSMAIQRDDDGRDPMRRDRIDLTGSSSTPSAPRCGVLPRAAGHRHMASVAG